MSFQTKSKGKILVVDDDEFVLSCLERMLRGRFEIDTALGGVRALESVFSRGPYDVVISDMKMPGMNGLTLLRNIRQMHPSIMGLLLTGDSDPNETEEALRSGLIYRAMDKPCNIVELINVVQEAVAIRQEQLNAG